MKEKTEETETCVKEGLHAQLKLFCNKKNVKTPLCMKQKTEENQRKTVERVLRLKEGLHAQLKPPRDCALQSTNNCHPTSISNNLKKKHL